MSSQTAFTGINSEADAVRSVLRKTRFPNFRLITYRSTQSDGGGLEPVPRRTVTARNTCVHSNSQVNIFNEKVFFT